jgi:hypothetical protein
MLLNMPMPRLPNYCKASGKQNKYFSQRQ